DRHRAALAGCARAAATAAGHARHGADAVADARRWERGHTERARRLAARADRTHAELVELRRQEAAAAHAASAGSTGGGGHLSTAGYANGQIPASQLQPLAGTHGAHRLQAPAATAFDAMSRAYRAQFGAPIAITDSYRSLPQQVELKQRKGEWAATPGTSEHGWGLAVDLGGGVECFGSAQHRWMQQHAPGFGFVHPDWAREGGSKPEPWHWEYRG
ncbi:M15 family metallopeptidase, partial [Angustibacter aerolatus]